MSTRPLLSLLRSKAWVGGSWVTAANGATFPVYNPSTGEKIAEVADFGDADTDSAIMEAYRAQKPWGATLAKERSQLLKRLLGHVISNRAELASIISLEMGKPYQDAQLEVDYAASLLEWFSEEAKRVYGDVIAPPVRGRRVIITKEPVGVAALITPWNFPLAMIMRKAATALAAGCTCVVKPSEETPLTALALAELTNQAEFPPGIFNILPSSRTQTLAVSNQLCMSPLVSAFSLTGSTAVGKLLMAKCAQTVKRVSMELGGNAPLVVFNSADVKQAVKGTIENKFRNTGQTCISCNRILVQSGIHDEYVAVLNEATSKLKQGDPFQEGVKQGPLINKAAIDKVESHVSDAVSKGAEVVVGGGRDETLGELFYKPSVLVGATSDMRLSHEETFGPIAPVIKFEDEEEAIAVANNTRNGLSSFIYTRDFSQMWRVGEAMETGMVGINEVGISGETIPFGGIKESGFGREGSKYGLNDYLNIKYFCMGGLEERS